MWYIARQQYFKINSKTYWKAVCYRKKGSLEVGCFVQKMMRLPIVRSGSVFHRHVGRTVGGVGHWEGYGWWMVVRKCGAGVWISFPGLFPCESEAQCLPSETWLRFRPDGPVLHLREPHRPRAQLSPSSLLSHLLHFLFFASILSLIQTQSPPPFFPFPFISRCLPLWASQFLTFFPLTLSSPPSHVPCLPLLLRFSTFASSLFALLHHPSLFFCVVECQRGEKAMRRSQITVGGGYWLNLYLLTLVPCARFNCLWRH